MDLKEIGICGVVVVGGTVYGISQGGLGDALSEDLRAYHEVSQAERPEYMQSVVDEFDETFDTYIIETENFTYVGHSVFSAKPAQGVFDEVVSHEEKIPRDALKDIKAQMKPDAFCAQDEMVMFTDKGWNYRFKLKDDRGRIIATVICNAQKNSGTV